MFYMVASYEYVVVLISRIVPLPFDSRGFVLLTAPVLRPLVPSRCAELTPLPCCLCVPSATCFPSSRSPPLQLPTARRAPVSSRSTVSPLARSRTRPSAPRSSSPSWSSAPPAITPLTSVSRSLAVVPSPRSTVRLSAAQQSLHARALAASSSAPQRRAARGLSTLRSLFFSCYLRLFPHSCPPGHRQGSDRLLPEVYVTLG
jgi:hypothetical protein